MTLKKYQSRLHLIGQRIKDLRIKAGYTSYEQFALDNDIERKQYWRLETGHNFQITTLFRILDIHRITLEAFFKDLN